MQTSFRSPFDVAHLWVHQLQNEAHYGSNFYFRNSTIYSYGAHFPIGKVIKYKGCKAFVLNSDHYSPTTSNHQNIVEQSIPVDAVIFHVSNCVSPVVVDNELYRYDMAMTFIANKLNEIFINLEKQRRARTADYRGNIICSISEIVQWIRFWGLDKPSKWRNGKLPKAPEFKHYPSVFQLWKESKFDTVKDYCNTNDDETAVNIGIFSLLNELGYLINVPNQVELIDTLIGKFYDEDCTKEINTSIKKAKIRYKRRLNMKKKIVLATQNKKLVEWQNGERESWYVGSEFREKYGWDTALRIENNQIETSKGVYLSLEEGHRLWVIVKAFEQGKQFQHDLVVDLLDHKWKLDNYYNHVLFAGCHSIPFSECQRIADIMHWE